LKYRLSQNNWPLFAILSSFSRCAVLFRRAAKKLSDFLFLNWFLHVFRFYFPMFSQMLSVKVKE